MIEVRLPNGTVVEFPDTMSESEIAAAIAEHLAAMAQDAPTGAEGVGATTIRPRLMRPTRSSVDVSPDSALEAEPAPAPPGKRAPGEDPEPPVPMMRPRFTVEPYRDDDQTGALTNRLPEALRRNLMRSTLPPSRFDAPTGDDPFRDNMHARWSHWRWPR